MPPDPDWQDATFEHEGVELAGKYMPRPVLQVYMTLPFDGIAVRSLEDPPTDEELPKLVAEILVGIYRTCVWVEANQRALRARYRLVVEAGQTSDEHMSLDRYFLAERTLEDNPHISADEQERLMKPLDARLTAWNNLRAKTLQLALDELGYDWPHAFQVLSRLAPHFDPHLATTTPGG